MKPAPFLPRLGLPRIAGDINDMQIKPIKVEGEFVWRSHEYEDELFLVLSGRLRMGLRGQEPIAPEPGEFLIVPHGVEHRPVAEEPCNMIPLELDTTLNTGNVEEARTGRDLKRIRLIRRRN